jgi:hypothetical protein
MVLGPFLAAAGLLVVAGVPKVADPMPLVRALRGAGLPAGRLPVRLFALAEVLVGSSAVAVPTAVGAALVAAAYVLFTGFVARVLTRGGVLGSCGCFGKADTPATRTHLVLTAAAALVGVAVALDPPAAPWSNLSASVVMTAGLAAVIGFLAWQVMAVLPTVSPAAIRSTGKG